MGKLKNSIGATYEGNKVPALTKWLFPLSGIFRDACYALVGSFLLQYAINSGVLSADAATFKAQYGVITVAMMIALVWDGINDPIMGFIVEKVHFKLGKFKPWILIGAAGNALAVIGMFLIRPTFADGSANGWAYVGIMIAFYFIWDLFFTMNDIGYWSMLPSLTNDEHERAQITSRMTVCASIGGFLMTAGCMLLPTAFSGISSAKMYAILAIAVAILFFASQLAVFLFCRERKRDLKQEEKSEEAHLMDLFRVVAKNPQVRVAVIGLFLYYLASGVLTGGIGLNYFYLSIGYGSGSGGLVSTVISVMYVAAMVSSQALYPIIAKKISKKKIMLITFIIQMVGFLGFFLCCIPLFGETSIALSLSGKPSAGAAMDFGWAFSGLMFLYYIFPFIFFFGMGMMYLAIMVMLQDAIDYNEYEYGERKESIISAWRPLTVKLSSALLRAFQYLIFLVAGLLTQMNGISNAENVHNICLAAYDPVTNPVPTFEMDGKTVVCNIETVTNNDGSKTVIDHLFNDTVDSIRDSASAGSLRVAGIVIVVILVASIVAAWACMHFGYKIDEEKHRQIVEELEVRHKAALATAGEAPAEVVAEVPEDNPKE